MRRQILLLLVAALLPLLVARGIIEGMSAANWQAGIRAAATDHADAVAALVSRELAADERAAQMIAQSPAFDHGLDQSGLSELAGRLVRFEPLWRAISITDGDGVRILDAPRAIGGLAHGRAVDLESQQRAFRTGDLVIGRLLIGQHGRPAFAVRAPVVRAGQVLYVVSIIVEPSNFRELLLAGGLRPGWRIRLMDDRGAVVAASDLPAGAHLSASEAAGEQAASANVQKETSLAGAQEMAVWRTVAKTGWRVQVVIPNSAYEAPVVRALTKVTLTTLAALALMALFIWLLTRELRREAARQTAAREAQRLEMLGRMTGGVAHDFNNLLMPIIGGLDLLQRRYQPDARAQRLIEACLKSAERAKALVSHLLAFARKQSLEPRDVDLTRLIEGLADLLEHALGDQIALVLKLENGLPSAKVDPVQLELALLNLAVNAKDAMPQGGRLSISAEETSALGELAGKLTPGRYVRIAVADTGAGMDRATLDQATEPFFTTKPPGSGTGLGLSMAHGLAAQSGGALRLQSELGVGTQVEIWLPAGEPITEAVALEQPEIGERRGRLLLVDDDDLVRSALADMLGEGGHEVAQASSAAEALEQIKAGLAVDLLLTDFAMPRMSGIELIREARTLRPGLNAMLITGYLSAVKDMPDGLSVMSKPFRQTELLARVAALLAEQDQRAA